MARMGWALKELGELRARSSMRLGAKSKHLERPEARDALAIMIASVRNKRHLRAEQSATSYSRHGVNRVSWYSMAERVYLDWNATAPLRPEAKSAMAGAWELAG